MINLLPNDTKQNYVYARRNVVLRRWVLLCLAALAGLAIVATISLVSMQQAISKLDQQVAAADTSLKTQDYDKTKQQVEDISGSFKLVVQVLSKEILFSQMLKQIAASIPAKANLTALNITQVQGGIDITAAATDYTTASQVQVNLADPTNKLFAKADLVSIVCDAKSAADPKYPCIATVRALFASNNPFLFINNKAVKP